MRQITTPKALKSAFASGVGALKNDIPNDTTGTYEASFEDGFPAITMQPLALGGTPPDGKDMNGILNVSTDYNFQFQNGFLPTFEQSVSDLIGGYPQGAILWYKDENSNVTPLISLIENNTYNFNDDTSYIDGAKWKPAIQQTAGRNIGDVFFTARTDDGLNGAVECNGAVYDSSDLQGSQTVISLLTNGKLPYVSMSTYASLLALNGSVGVFGWDGVGTTEFRVPTLTDIFIETGTAAQVGDYLPAAIPNVVGSFSSYQFLDVNPTGVFTETVSAGRASEDHSGNVKHDISFDASRASSVYKNNASTVQPETIRYRAMIQLFISTTDDAVATCTSVLVSVGSLKEHELIEYQAPTAQNNYTWYRKYRDGWVEQGGLYASTFTGTVSITYPIEMSDSNYTLATSVGCPNVSGMHGKDYVSSRSSTGFQYTSVSLSGSFTNQNLSWFVAGLFAN